MPLTLYVMFARCPGRQPADDIAGALVIAADRPPSRFPRGSVVYVKARSAPCFSKHFASNILPSPCGLTGRTEDRCADRDRLSGCERDSYLKLEVLSSPTRGSCSLPLGLRGHSVSGSRQPPRPLVRARGARYAV
jgi:hypothetical protein